MVLVGDFVLIMEVKLVVYFLIVCNEVFKVVEVKFIDI